MSPLLAVAALSARMLAEAARDGGYRPVALDLFGDRDTRRAAEAWFPIGEAARLALDGAALLAALRRLRGQGAAAWIAGSGFEAHPELLAAGAQVLPLAGNAAPVVARVRDPAAFYGRLAALGIAHPETRRVCPPAPPGWLRKNAASSGGWEVRPARREDAGGSDPPHRPEASGTVAATGGASPGIYYQRVAPGMAMSALFLADGRRSRLLGVNRQIVRRLGARPYVFRGCIGPVAVAPGVWRTLEGMLDALTADFGLRGLNGLDFLLDDERVNVLELNPRPPASIALYREALAGGLVRAHVAASLEGRLPDAPARGAGGAGAALRQRGFEIVFAHRHCKLSGRAADALAQPAWCHDLPAPGTHVARGEPLCSVAAAGNTVADVEAQLLQRRRQISFLLEQIDDGSSEGLGLGTLECQ